MTETENTANELWWFLNPKELTPPDHLELAEAVKFVQETDAMIIDFNFKIAKLRRKNVSNIDG